MAHYGPRGLNPALAAQTSTELPIPLAPLVTIAALPCSLPTVTLPSRSSREGRCFVSFYIRCSARSTSSTSLYHFFLVPTLALSFQPTDFGSFSIMSSNSLMRPEMISRSSGDNTS